MRVADVVRELGGDPEGGEKGNLQLLANEIVILRERLKQSDDEVTRGERRIGKEIEARNQAERRADAAEGAIVEIEVAIARAKREALKVGAPLKDRRLERVHVGAGDR